MTVKHSLIGDKLKGDKMDKEQIKKAVESGKEYLLSKIVDGLCPEFHALRHRASSAWSTACVGSSLMELGIVTPDMLEAILGFQREEGGWSYNQTVPPDSDTTLRVMQFLRKVGFRDRTVLWRAEEFVLALQQTDGGIATFSSDAVAGMVYEGEGWASSHPCVTALAINQLINAEAIVKAQQYMRDHLSRYGSISYWWRTPYYVLYEMGLLHDVPLVERDSIELGLVLLLQAKHGICDAAVVQELLSHQREDGSFIPSSQLRIPHPHQKFEDLDGSERVAKDARSIFSTCTAIVAFDRILKLLR